MEAIKTGMQGAAASLNLVSSHPQLKHPGLRDLNSSEYIGAHLLASDNILWPPTTSCMLGSDIAVSDLPWKGRKDAIPSHWTS